jgi:hypothetical protein
MDLDVNFDMSTCNSPRADPAANTSEKFGFCCAADHERVHTARTTAVENFTKMCIPVAATFRHVRLCSQESEQLGRERIATAPAQCHDGGKRRGARTPTPSAGRELYSCDILSQQRWYADASSHLI